MMNEMEQEFSQNIKRATKWSSLTELCAKLVTPIISIFLARILAPSEFGIIASMTMVISFADMLSDSGFQKFLIQHEFCDENQKYLYANTAFTINIIVSTFLWLIIIAFSTQITIIINSPEKQFGLILSASTLPITSFSSLQSALFKRSFNFKVLFISRIVTIVIPFVITIPFAFLFRNYYALILGTIAGSTANAIILTAKSKWKPKLAIRKLVLARMLSFSIWSLFESISIWFTSWIDVFIIGSLLSQNELGLFRTSINTVNGITSIITAATTTVLFSALSRLQNNQVGFKACFFRFQRLVGMVVLPLGMGIFLFQSLITRILLGSQWIEAQSLVGLWGLVSGISIIISSYCSEGYRAKGLPRISLIVQIIYLPILIIVCYYSASDSFQALTFARTFVRLAIIPIHCIFLNRVLNIRFFDMFKNVLLILVASIAMGAFGWYLHKLSHNTPQEFLVAIACIIFYFGFIIIFKSGRKDTRMLFRYFSKRLAKNKSDNKY